ncbi:Uncharacterized protein BP5553_07510 [Venustampulla echinocandica]|uniref:CYTH domain-containing protein n=1 Tax=Venustampulla echinocandica TaxID=2656787 RepID=A0A370TGQ6_9HELO|nr:Uncharacterized protein BP5553_07510 [Venustampulla echinocandica]RDL34382.1 Uncharacterized protein BP5553_07510 [Venustampulla echinocandica]
MVLYEVEQKFAFNATLLALFRANRGTPPFHRLQRLGTKKFEDVYFDSANKLSKNGLWVRKRNNTWEAKSGRSGNFLRTTFHETTDVSEIKTLVNKQVSSRSCGPDDNFGLDILCRYCTTRESFVVDEKFAVVLDETDFGHSVGEVELTARDEKSAHADIDAFMEKYSWFFLQGGKPTGKITAYFQRFGRASIP